MTKINNKQNIKTTLFLTAMLIFGSSCFLEANEMTNSEKWREEAKQLRKEGEYEKAEKKENLANITDESIEMIDEVLANHDGDNVKTLNKLSEKHKNKNIERSKVYKSAAEGTEEAMKEIDKYLNENK